MVWKVVSLVVLAALAVGSWVFIFVDRNRAVPADNYSYSAPATPSVSPTSASGSPSPSAAATPAAAAKITLPEDAKVVMIGDSWTSGYAAEPRTDGFAYLTADSMGWDLTNLGLAGTGYVNAGPNDEGDFADRIANREKDEDIDLVIIQGGLSDASSEDADDVTAGATKAIRAASTTWPKAQLIILGPCPSRLPATSSLTSVDSQLAALTSTRRINYLSCLKQNWINSSNYEEVIDADSSYRPSTAGHAYLAKQLEAGLRKIIVTG